MAKRYVSIWFPYLITDWLCNTRPELRNTPFVICNTSHGRMIITALNAIAEVQGIYKGMVLADARVHIAGLQHFNDKQGLADKLLHRIAEWCIRFTPVAAVDGGDGILLDASGCSHLWGGDENYVAEIIKRLRARGYTNRASIADTVGAAWAISRYAKQLHVIPKGKHAEALLKLPAEALRIEGPTVERLNKLGLRQVKDFIEKLQEPLTKGFKIESATVQYLVHWKDGEGREVKIVLPEIVLKKV